MCTVVDDVDVDDDEKLRWNSDFGAKKVQNGSMIIMSCGTDDAKKFMTMMRRETMSAAQ